MAVLPVQANSGCKKNLTWPHTRWARPALIYILISTPVLSNAHSTTHARIDEINHQLTQTPDDVYLILTRVHVLIEQGDLKKAANEIDRAAILAPGNPDVIYHKAHLAEASQQFESAIEFYSQHLRLVGFRIDTVYARAQCYKHIKAFDKAIADYQYLIHDAAPLLRPDYFFELADLFEHQKLYSQGLAVLDQGLEHFGLLTHFQRKAIDLELALQHYPQALQRNETLRATLGKTPEWQYQQAQLLIATGQKKAGQEQLKQALATVDQHLKKKTRTTWQQLRRDIQVTLTRGEPL